MNIKNTLIQLIVGFILLSCLLSILSWIVWQQHVTWKSNLSQYRAVVRVIDKHMGFKTKHMGFQPKTIDGGYMRVVTDASPGVGRQESLKVGDFIVDPEPEEFYLRLLENRGGMITIRIVRDGREMTVKQNIPRFSIPYPYENNPCFYP